MKPQLRNFGRSNTTTCCNLLQPYRLEIVQALHALALADTKLCMPSKDPAQFVRALAPYLKVPGVAVCTQHHCCEPPVSLNLYANLPFCHHASTCCSAGCMK